MSSIPILLTSNLAGGSGKTTASHTIAAACAEYGKRTLVVDADPAATLTFRCGVENPRISIAELITGDFASDLAMVKTPERFTLIPGASRSYGKEGNWSWLNTLDSQFDLVILDTPTGPSRTLLDLASYATLVLVPMNDSFLSLRGAVHTRDFLRSAANKSELLVLPQQCSHLQDSLVGAINGQFVMLQPGIRFDLALREAEITTRTVLAHASQSDAASDYREVAYTLLEKMGLF